MERLSDPQNFLSLLHYFGLLSIRDVIDGVPRLGAELAFCDAVTP